MPVRLNQVQAGMNPHAQARNASADVMAQVDKELGIRAVVVSYWSAPTIENCLQRLLAATDVVQVVVVDNGSGDATAEIIERLAANDPRLSLQRNQGNPGFAAACNQGAKECMQPWLAFVNPDCLVEPDTFVRMLGCARSMPSIGVLGCEQVDATGARDPAARRSGVSLRALLFVRHRRDAIEIPSDGSALQRVGAISGALMLSPRAEFEQVGGFDAGYRLHAEDLDLCRRVRAGGRVVAVANDVVVTHLRGVSSRRQPLWVEWQKHRGLWRYFQKFDAADTSIGVRVLLRVALWVHFALVAPRVMFRRS
jgi:GT2 family glycosyltransferase